jgi:hypothetical protein
MRRMYSIRVAALLLLFVLATDPPHGEQNAQKNENSSAQNALQEFQFTSANRDNLGTGLGSVATAAPDSRELTCP